MRDYVPIKRETLSRFANIARRFGKVDKDLFPDEMIRILETVDATALLPDNVTVIYFGTASSTLDVSGILASNAIGG